MEEHLYQEINSILDHLAFSAAAATEPGRATAAGADRAHESEHQAEPQSPPPIIVYLVDTPPAEMYDDYDQEYAPDAYAGTVESLPRTEEQEPAAATPAKEAVPAAGGATPLSAQPSIPKRPRQKGRRGALVGVLGLLLAGAALAAFLLAPLSASATVTIIPQARAISTTTTLSVVTAGTANPRLHEIPGRLLSSLTLSQAESVPTSGTGHQPAQAAHGSITFYNAAPYPQSIAAGTLLTGSDGTQVVTEEDAVIPAVSYPTLGTVTVPAQAVLPGPAGNIGTGDIYGPCCRLNVSAVNGAFTGGQDARSFPMVTPQDLNGVVSLLKADLLQSVEAAFAAQVRPTESLLTPRCTPQMSSDHQVGEEATHLSVTVSETCTATVYETEALHDLVKQDTTQAAIKQVGAGYTESGDVQATVIASTVTGQKPGTFLLRVKGTGTWASQFTDAELHEMARLITGKSRTQASHLLLHLPGVSQVGVTVSGGGSSLPAVASDIHVLVLNQPS